MKNLINGALILLVACFGSQCKSTIPPTAEVTFLTSKHDVLNLRSIGYGKTNDESLHNAHKNAFEIVFFRGVPGSQQSNPLVSINEREKDNSRKYFDEFFQNSRYRTFLTSMQQVSDFQGVKGGKSVTVDLGINLKALRADLENHNVIRKFGY